MTDINKGIETIDEDITGMHNIRILEMDETVTILERLSALQVGPKL